MLDPLVVEVAQMRPGVCALCRTHVGPFVDTRVELAVVGHVYVCVKTCGGQIAALGGFVPGETLAERDRQLADAIAEVADLEAALERAGEARVVPFADVERLLSRGVGTVRACSAKRRDGSPCSGTALPGRETCVAHTRVAA